MPEASTTYKAWHICDRCGTEFEMTTEFDPGKHERGLWQEVSASCSACGTLNTVAIPPKSERGDWEARKRDKEALAWITNRIVGGNGW